MSVQTDVKNLPDYPLRKYVVARPFDGVLWFWGTWDDKDKAREVAREMNGVVVTND